MKDKIINEIISKLTPLKDTDTIINDLKNNNLNSLENFIKQNNQDNINLDLKDLVINLVQNKKIANTYLELINDKENFKLLGFTPLNIRSNNYQNILLKIKNDNITNPEISVLNKKPNNDFDDEILTLEDSHIEKLRKVILDAQLNYLNNATSFILELENKDSHELYQTLLSLNDIRYIHHSMSKLSKDTLNRLLDYVTELLKENSHNSINIFIEEAIKKILHEK